MMKKSETALNTLVLLLLAGLVPALAHAAFSSGSTGADGAFNPTENVEVQLPPSGILNYTTVNIPAGVTVTFRKNANNTPVTILASGDVTIAGIIDVSGKPSQDVGTSLLADYTAPGAGGPGGFDGGRGGRAQVNVVAGSGLGPGGGNGTGSAGGGGGGYRSGGAAGSGSTSGGGPAYGTDFLVPLLGGSGGGGGRGGTTYQGSGGGGGGGAILIAASGTANLTGTIRASGGKAGQIPGNSTCGGGGSGGAIRIVASTLAGTGTMDVNGGGTCTGFGYGTLGGGGSIGRVRTEQVSQGTFVSSGYPTLTISSVGGISVPAAPTGSGDVALPTEQPNPVTVVINTTGVPVTNTVTVTMTPDRGAAPVKVTSPALTGTVASATTSVEVDIPTGPSTLFATTTYTITVAQGEALSKFAMGERVERVMLTANLNGPSTMTLITVSGKEHTVPSTLVAGILGS